MAYQNPSVQNFKDWFNRDFPYGTDPEVAVTDTDIANSYVQSNLQINQNLYPEQSAYTLGYLNLSAHYLSLKLRAASQGINGQWNFMEQSKSAGNVSQAFAVPQQFLDNPYWAMFTKTSYGMAFLEQIMPFLVGQVQIAFGSTRP